MATLGQILKEAREQKGVTVSQAAAATHMKVQIVEALERDDFSRMAASMYAKGFIKLYAEYLALDPAPLVREYLERYAPKERAPLLAGDGSLPGEPKTEPKRNGIDWLKLKSLIDKWKKPAAVGAGAIVFFVLVVNGVSRCSRRITEPRQIAAPPVAERKVALPVNREPPEPYIETSGTAPQTP